jgi:hypothetical protein
MPETFNQLHKKILLLSFNYTHNTSSWIVSSGFHDIHLQTLIPTENQSDLSYAPDFPNPSEWISPQKEENESHSEHS